MEALNNKIFASRDDHYTQAQVVGVTGYNSTQDAMKVAHVTDSNELKVAVTTGGGGGTQYDIGDAVPADGTGTIALVKDPLGNAATMEVNTGGELRTSTAGISVGSDDTLTQAQQVLGYARKDASPSGLRALKCADDGTLHNYDTGLNMKITNGSDDSITGDLQQVLNYGKFDGDGTLRSLKTTSDGTIFVNNTRITTGSDATLSTAQQILVYGRDSGGGVDALKVDNTGKLEVVQDPEQQVGTISSVSNTINSGTALTYPVVIDKNGAENMNCLVTASSSLLSCNAYFLLSDDNITFYETPYAQTFGDTTAGYVTELGNPSRYVKIKIENNGGSNIDITSVKLTFVKGI